MELSREAHVCIINPFKISRLDPFAFIHDAPVSTFPDDKNKECKCKTCSGLLLSGDTGIKVGVAQFVKTNHAPHTIINHSIPAFFSIFFIM